MTKYLIFVCFFFCVCQSNSSLAQLPINLNFPQNFIANLRADLINSSGISNDSSNCGIVVPNFYTNSPCDMGQRYFIIQGSENYDKVELLIFNRWGTLVYEDKNYTNDWDGFIGGNNDGESEHLPEGTYFYIIKLFNEDNESCNDKVMHGYVYMKIY